MSYVPRPMAELALDEDGYRSCARPDCPSHFKPERLSNFYCSETCATRSFFERRGMKLPEKMLVTAEQKEETREARRLRMKALREKLAAEGRLPKGRKRLDLSEEEMSRKQRWQSKRATRELRTPWEGAIPLNETGFYAGGSRAAWMTVGMEVTILGHIHTTPEHRRYVVVAKGKRTIIKAGSVSATKPRDEAARINKELRAVVEGKKKIVITKADKKRMEKETKRHKAEEKGRKRK